MRGTASLKERENFMGKSKDKKNKEKRKPKKIKGGY